MFNRAKSCSVTQIRLRRVCWRTLSEASRAVYSSLSCQRWKRYSLKIQQIYATTAGCQRTHLLPWLSSETISISWYWSSKAVVKWLQKLLIFKQPVPAPFSKYMWVVSFKFTCSTMTWVLYSAVIFFNSYFLAYVDKTDFLKLVPGGMQ